MLPIPDLLEPTPRLRFDTRLLAETLTFAFATGSTPDAFERVLKSVDVGPSTFRSEHFARDLFLKELVARCLCSSERRERYPLQQRPLLALLSHPTSDLDTLRFRHSILSSLVESPEAARAMAQAVSELRYLFELFQGGERARHGGAVARRIDLLRALRTCVDKLERDFAALGGPLERVTDFLRAVKSSEGFAHLLDLLDYEGNLATVDLRVRVGLDGEIREFAIQRVSENQRSPWYRSPLQRFFVRLSLLFRGFRIRDSELVGRLVEQVFDGLQETLARLYQLTLDCEFYVAALRFRALAAKKGLAVCLPELVPGKDGAAPLELETLFNPFLLLESDPPVPCDLPHRAEAISIITGPNSGGKTRLLQSIGLTQLLAQSGLFVPARRARLALRSGMFVSLVQEAEADQSEGRLGTELVRIRRLFESLPVGGLAILDELCSGTNPSEGEQIFELLVSLLGELSPTAFISTHFLGLAARLAEAPRDGSLAFLEVELGAHGRPTYRFVPGVAKTSLALGVAERLGVTRESLLALLDARRAREQAPRAVEPFAPRSSVQ